MSEEQQVQNPPAAKPGDAAPNAQPAKSDFQGYRDERIDARRRSRGGLQERIDTLVKDKSKSAEAAQAAADAAKKAAADAEAARRAAQNGNGHQRPIQEIQAETERLREANEIIGRFHANANEYKRLHPTVIEDLHAAAARGLDMPPEAQATLLTLDNGPQVAHWLSKPENEETARRLQKLKGPRASAEIGMIAARLESRSAAFVSQAPTPGTRLTGASTSTDNFASGEKPEFSEYARRRREEKRR